MRVVVDASYAVRGPSGTAVYVERIAAALRDLGVDVVTVADEDRRPPAGGGLGSVRNLAHDRWWVQRRLPRLAKQHRADVLHHPLPAAAWRPGRGPQGPVAQAVTVHDLAFEVVPELFDPRFARWASVAHRRAAGRADVVIAVSRTTATDVRERWGVPADRVVVAPHGPGQWRAREIRHGETMRADTVPLARPYLLYIGDEEPRKDLATLRRAHREVVARRGDDAPDLVLAGAIAEAADTDRVRVVARPDADRLQAVIDGALMLVHPARHEGVGLTPLEAMARGVPVVVARSPGLTETCGDGAAFFAPGDDADLVGVLERLLDEPRMRDRLVQAGRRVAGARSWEHAAAAHVEAYEAAIDRARRR